MVTSSYYLFTTILHADFFHPPSYRHRNGCWYVFNLFLFFSFFLPFSLKIGFILVWTGAGAAGFWYTGNFDAMLDYVNSYHFGPAILYGAKCVLAYPLVYHYMNGMRHLAWDYAIGFDMKTVNTTGLTVLILSVFVTLALASIKT